MPLWLIGMMGSGKSTVGRVIAGRRGWVFVDTDLLVTNAAGRSITEVFAVEGESGFRKRESEAISVASTYPGAVVATGGGAVLSDENIETMRSTGLVFWLQAEPATLASRLEGGDVSQMERPLIFDRDVEQTLGGMLDERDHRYREAADYMIGTDLLTPEEAADLLEALWHE